MRKINLIKITLISFLTLFLVSANSYASDFEDLINAKDTSKVEVFDFLSSVYNDTVQSSINEYYDQVVRRERSWTAGLSATASYLSNGNNYGLDEDYLSYRNRLAVGLQWDILKFGRYASSIKADQADIARKEELLHRHKQEFLISMEGKRLYIEQLYWEELSYWRRVEALIQKTILDWNTAAYDNHLITELELTLSKERYRRIKSSAFSISNDTSEVEVYELALPKFYLSPSFLGHLDSIKLREQSILEQRKLLIEKENDKLSTIDLSPTIKYNMYDQNSKGFNAYYFSYGVRLNIPFSILHKNETELEQEKYDKDFRVRKHTTQQEVITQYYQLFRYVEEINLNIDMISKIQIENAGRVGNYNNVKRDYYDRLLDIIYHRRKICTHKRNAFYTLIYILELCEGTDALDHIVFY